MSNVLGVFEIPERNMEQLYIIYEKLVDHGIEKEPFEIFCGRLLIEGWIILSKELVATQWYTSAKVE